MEHLHLKIDGMSCGHCVARVEKALKKLDGVAVVRVEVGAPRSSTIRRRPPSPASVRRSTMPATRPVPWRGPRGSHERRGGLHGRARIDIPVQGMTCAACQASVQRALQRQPGVLDAAVNLMMKSAAVTYDPAVTRPEALVEAIRDTGYEAELPRPDETAFAEQEARDRADAEEFRTLRRKALASGAAGVVAMLVSMPLMAAGAHRGPVGDPFMRWAMASLTPALRAVLPWLYRIPAAVLSWTLLALTLGVMAWAGRHFYARAWSALRHRSADMNTLVAVGTGAAFLVLGGRHARARLLPRRAASPRTSTTRRW